MALKNRYELVKQIEAYGLKQKLSEVARKDRDRRPFRHLPKQFSKGILIGNIAIVPKKHTGTRYIYVIADMIKAHILYDDINLKQTAILVAHHIADGNSAPENVIEYDTHFASQLFNITNAKRMMKMARKEENDAQEEVYQQRLETAHHLADQYKGHIQQIFQSTFST
tara:strand:+ start:70 stop:573 length:504 start_codon:yes stop_codon:yes gene_type:complete